MPIRRLPNLPSIVLLLCACAGCAGEGSAAGDNPDTAQAREAGAAASVAFRVPAGGGQLRAYFLPGLEATPWRIGGVVSPVRSVVGVDVPGRRLVYRDSSGNVAAFDLVAFRERTVAPPGSRAALGADGTLLAVDTGGTVIESQPWGRRTWAATVGRGVSEVFVGPGARLVTVRHAGGDTLAAASRETGVSLAAPVPAANDRSATRDGDAVAFATDSGVVVLEDREAEHPWFVRLGGTPSVLAFSPSGHRIFVALRDKSELAVIDRFTRRERPAIALPEAAAALRADPWGRVLLARPGPAGETGEAWVVSVARERVVGSVVTPWASDLPAVSSSGILLAREGGALVARDARTLDSLGAVADGAGDLWFVGEWAPARATAAVRQAVRVADTTSQRQPRAAAQRSLTAAPQAPPAPAASLWVQVSSSQNESWARALATELAQQGNPATVIPPANLGDGWRVVMGPYPSRNAADSAGRATGRPYWIVDRGAAGARKP